VSGKNGPLKQNAVKSNQIKSLFESGKSPYTQAHTRIHKTQYTIKEETMKLKKLDQ